jgi:serine/threonine protein kinase
MTGSVPFYSSNIMQQYQYIMKENVRYPDYLPQHAKSFIAGLLDRDPNTRYNADDCKVHPFFEGIDWVKLEKKELTPPFVPETDEDERYFDEGFTGEDIHAVSDDECDDPSEQPKFVGFTYDGRADNHLLQ